MIADRNQVVQHLLMKGFLFFSVLILPLSLFAEGGLPNQPSICVEGTAQIQETADVSSMKLTKRSKRTNTKPARFSQRDPFSN
jgi:hypothetical protein